MKYIDLKDNNIIEKKESRFVLFLYNNFFGRLILKVLTLRIISVIGGLFLNSKFSCFLINKTVKKNNIDITRYEDKMYKSYNDFFTRKIKKLKLDEGFISPCDAKLSVYKIDKNSYFKIKGTMYSIEDLINEKLDKSYIGGYALIFRLEVTDYHRYIYVDSGRKSKNKYIKGILHTVRPIVLNYVNIYKRNSREYTILDTDNFGKIIEIEVGALLVGKINNHHEEYTFKRGEEKGNFEFGGSTIVLLIEKNKVDIDKKIIENTKNDIETIVKIGTKIGEKL